MQIQGMLSRLVGCCCRGPPIPDHAVMIDGTPALSTRTRHPRPHVETRRCAHSAASASDAAGAAADAAAAA
eukprot:CAMPEP_0183467250 /NCGR_PEP_ID=MMETSP0370-20130417/150534_1 /TAXON_ID=268820 /ORGANISM="Peridinium aciculiferum, Strain PAER-2" /LENGTH=70 /DNA_ID=CAMNT_0025659577 /DNA_START=195 /DNA_END=403 /DNA_ORIENTATION=-